MLNVQEIQVLKKLTNDELFARAKDEVREEENSTLRVLYTLREIERRRAFALKSYPSLYEFCVDFLGYKKGAAYRRILAMEALKELPEVEERIREGALSLMTLSQAQGYFKAQRRQNKSLPVEQKREVIKTLENKSSRQTEEYFLEVMPKEPLKEKLKQISPERYQCQMTWSKAVKEKFDEFRSLLGQEANNLENIEILERALDLASEVLKRQQSRIDQKQQAQIQEQQENQGAQKFPTLGKTEANMETIIPKTKSSSKIKAPFKIKLLWIRDQSQCTYVDPMTNIRCSQRTKLEIDHIRPRALGGDSSLENLRLLCKAHNQRAAINTLGLTKMNQYLG
jgi:5-methylcytosine-specific restriction endonuclease McrA